MAGMRWLTWVVALLLLTTQAAGQTSADNLVDFFISEGFSIYNGLTSALGSAASAASAASASSSDAAASASASTTDGGSPTATNTAAGIGTTARPASASSRSNDPVSTFRSSSRTSESSASSTATSRSSASAGAAAASGSQGGGGGDNNLAIILGCVLGALALGLFILALLLCCKRRRRHRSESSRSQALSPDDHEVASWAQPGTGHHRHHRSNREFLAGAGAGAAPLMSEHPAFRNHQEHENPFVPVPPPPRRSAPNSRTGLTDGMVPGDHPYLIDSGTGHPIARETGESSHMGRNAAIGAGAAALGAAAMHHQNKVKDEGVEVNNPYSPHRNSGISRKPVPVNDNLTRGSWAAPSPTADDVFAMNKPGGRRSIDSARSRASRDAARANAAFDNQYAPVPAHDEDHGLRHDNDHHNMGTAAALGAGALGGAALAQHHHGHTHSHSRSLSRSRSPQRRSLLAAKKHNSDNSNTSSDISNSSNSKEYADAVPHQHHMSGGVGGNDMANPILDAPSHDPYHGVLSPANVPPAPQTRSRRNSPLGTAAPAAAALSYVDSDPQRQRERSTSRPRTYPYPYPNTPDDFNRGREMSGGWATPPASGFPSSSPQRSSYRQSADYPRGQGNDYEAFPTVMPGPLSSNVHSAMNPYPSPPMQVYDQVRPRDRYIQNEYPRDVHPQDPFPREPFPQAQDQYFQDPSTIPSAPHPLTQGGDGVSTPGLENLHTSTGIVGDSRYPHLNVPRRRSGGEYDLANDESYLPKGVPDGRSRSRSGSMSASRDASRSGSRKNSMNISVSGARPPLIGGTGSGYESEDSTWRLSSSMPGGWGAGKHREESPRRSRRSGEVGRSPLVNPLSPDDGTGAGRGGSGVGGMGGGTGPSAGNGGWGSLGWERDRDSLVSGSTAVGSAGNSGAGVAALGNVGAGRARLSLADLRRQEEEMMRLRGRQSMQAEWVGYDGGYDGYGGGGVGGTGGGGGNGRESRYYADQAVGVAK